MYLQKGSSFTIRKFTIDPTTPTELIRRQNHSAELLTHTWLAVKNKKSIIGAGGTGSGKHIFYTFYDIDTGTLVSSGEIIIP